MPKKKEKDCRVIIRVSSEELALWNATKGDYSLSDYVRWSVNGKAKYRLNRAGVLREEILKNMNKPRKSKKGGGLIE